jgi:hypothetical protein
MRLESQPHFLLHAFEVLLSEGGAAAWNQFLFLQRYVDAKEVIERLRETLEPLETIPRRRPLGGREVVQATRKMSENRLLIAMLRLKYGKKLSEGRAVIGALSEAWVKRLFLVLYVQIGKKLQKSQFVVERGGGFHPQHRSGEAEADDSILDGHQAAFYDLMAVVEMLERVVDMNSELG